MTQILNLKDIDWENPTRGYYLTEVKEKILWEDKNTGATLVLLRLPEGIADKPHSHSEANQIAIGLSGEIEAAPGGAVVPLQADMVFFTPKGEKHGGGRFTKESILLHFWDGPTK